MSTARTEGIASIEEAIAAIKAGRPVIVADNEDRENEGDVIISAELASAEWIAWTVHRSSGLLCAPMTNEIADQLDLPMMVERNEDVRGTAYTVTVDAAEGVTTGHQRAAIARRPRACSRTPTRCRRMSIVPATFSHFAPLTVASARATATPKPRSSSCGSLALREVAIIAEIVADDGEMMRLPGLIELGDAEGVLVITIEKLIGYLNEHDPDGTPAEQGHSRRVSLRADTLLPTDPR